MQNTTIKISNNDPEGFDSEKIAMEAEKRGYCVLSTGEYVTIKGGEFLVESLGRKEILFICPKNIKDIEIKKGEEITIKNGNFVIENIGSRFMKVRGLPGNNIFDQAQIDDARRKYIKEMQKKNKNK